MRLKSLVRPVFFLFFLGAEPVWSVSPTVEKRPVTVVDSIGMTTLADRSYLNGGVPQNGIAQFSPDRTKFVVTLRRGNVEKNTNEYSLLLWRTKQINRPIRPARLLTMSSSSNRPAIRDITWLGDNETVAFLGEQPGESQQLYTFNTRTRRLRRKTNHSTNLFSYAISPNGTSIVFVAEAPLKGIWDQKGERDGIIIDSQYLPRLLTDKSHDPYASPQLYSKQLGRDAQRIATKGMLTDLSNNLSLSPNGRYLVLTSRVADIPASWKDYLDSFVHTETALILNPGEASSLRRLELIDLSSGQSRVLVNAPVSQRGFGPKAIWEPRGLSVAISDLYLPLEGTIGETRELRKSNAFSVEIQVPSGVITEISRDKIEIIEWNSRRDLLVAKRAVPNSGKDSNSTLFFRKIAGVWHEIHAFPSGEVEPIGPEIVLQEDMNTSPKLFNRSNGKQTLLFNLNPQFDLLKFGKEEEIHWTAKDGQEFRSGLYYPSDYVSGRRYPLVIQTHGFNPNRFWIDGPFSTAFAAQTLAGKGFMVLQVEDGDGPYDHNSPQVVDRALSRFETGVDYLDARGLIDRKRVGLIGFSRTCWFVKYALTHSRYHFAAASVTDGIDGGYFQYLLDSSISAYDQIYEGMNGGMPWGQGLNSWLQRSPGFNIESVRTPVRIVALNPVSALFEWEWHAALVRLGRPVEMVMIRDGAHLLEKPFERMVSLQGNVDWFAFWLNGEEDTNARAEQYDRWHKLRDQMKVNPN